MSRVEVQFQKVESDWPDLSMSGRWLLHF